MNEIQFPNGERWTGLRFEHAWQAAVIAEQDGYRVERRKTSTGHALFVVFKG